MNFDVIKPDEVRLMYEQATDKRKQVTVMAQLMACEEADVCDILGIPHTKKRKNGSINEEKALGMHLSGATDLEIADEFGVTKDAVYHWKWRTGLVQQSEEFQEKYKKCLALYEQGLKDGEIAEKTGLSLRLVCYWRKRNGLPANGKRVSRDWAQDDIAFRPLYDKGMTDAQIAAVSGCHSWNVRDWRKKRKLKHNKPDYSLRHTNGGRPRKDWTEEDRLFRPLYEQGLNDPQIAKETGADKRNVCEWRRKFGLLPQGRRNK